MLGKHQGELINNLLLPLLSECLCCLFSLPTIMNTQMFAEIAAIDSTRDRYVNVKRTMY